MCADCDDCPFINSVESDWHEIHITCTDKDKFLYLCNLNNIKAIVIQNFHYPAEEVMTSVKLKGTYQEVLGKAAEIWNILAPAMPIRKKIEASPFSNASKDYPYGYWELHAEVDYEDSLLLLGGYLSKNANKNTCILTFRGSDKLETKLPKNYHKTIKEYCWYDRIY